MSRISSILYPPTLEYSYLIQRPQHLMKTFSEIGIPSFFLNNSNVYSKEKRGIRKLNENFYLVYNVDPRPFLSGIRPVIYYTSPVHVEMIHTYNPSLVIFDSVDEPSDEFEAWRPYYYRAVSTADVVLAASDKLYHMALSLNHNTHLVPNACDYQYFSGNTGVPEEIQGISRPVIGYIGVMASWCDFDLLSAAAKRLPHCNFVMIGPLYNVEEVPQLPNLHWLGFKPYEMLASYVNSFDVGIIPFKNTSMTESVNPIKMWEYMAAGIPVVTSALPEAQKYGDLVLHSNNEDEFIDNINRSLYSDSEEKRRARKWIAEQNSWVERAQRIIEIIEYELLKRDISRVEINIPNELMNPGYWESINASAGASHSLSRGNTIRVSMKSSFGKPRGSAFVSSPNAASKWAGSSTIKSKRAVKIGRG